MTKQKMIFFKSTSSRESWNIPSIFDLHKSLKKNYRPLPETLEKSNFVHHSIEIGKLYHTHCMEIRFTPLPVENFAFSELPHFQHKPARKSEDHQSNWCNHFY